MFYKEGSELLGKVRDFDYHTNNLNEKAVLKYI